MKKYNPKDEYKVNINLPEIQLKIKEAKDLYQSFIEKNIKKIDLNNPNEINQIYNEAKELGIFNKAEEMRNLIFGKDIYFYGVSYLWDACQNYCTYCPGSITNRKEAIKQGKEYPLRELSIDEAIEDTKALIENGHQNICYLTGSSPGTEKLPKKIINYLKEIDELGLEEIILNIEPTTDKGFEIIRNAVKKTPLQYRIFQETYDKETYKKVHPKGIKSDYEFRINAQSRAIKAGFDNVGLGFLLGLHQYPIEEIENLKKHAEKLELEYSKKPIRVCLPSANELTNIGVEIPYKLKKGVYSNKGEQLIKMNEYEKLNELIYALARLAMPTINIVSSERDKPGMLKILDKYATCTTLNVKPTVGGNAEIFPSEDNICFEQATSFSRDTKKTIEEMKKRDYNPIIKF